MSERKGVYRVLGRKLEERAMWKAQGNGRIILRQI
jgi:hypothetical protein